MLFITKNQQGEYYINKDFIYKYLCIFIYYMSNTVLPSGNKQYSRQMTLTITILLYVLYVILQD